MIIQAIPGSGKTFAARANAVFVDSDDLLKSLGKTGEVGYDEVRSDASLSLRLASAILTHSEEGKIVLCNFDPAELGLEVAKRYAYRPDEYVSHLSSVGRTDILSQFRTSELVGWASDYASKRNVTFLRKGQFLPVQTILLHHSHAQRRRQNRSLGRV